MKEKKPLSEPIIKLNRMVRFFYEQTFDDLTYNRMMQHIYPSEVYEEYMEINQIRRRKGQWYSTGKGAKSFDGKVTRQPTKNNTSFSLLYKFNDYMRYAEIGVGRGTHAEDVQRSKKGHWNVRYTSRWNRKMGRSHRPAFMMQFRHLQTRLRDYMSDYYGGYPVVNLLEGIPEKINLGTII